MKNETSDDIERELREYGDRPPPRRAWIDLADRLNAAYKRDMQAIVDANETAIRTAMGEIAKLREENERLKAALKPVLENVDTDYYTLSNAKDALDACSEAQRIYEGGAE